MELTLTVQALLEDTQHILHDESSKHRFLNELQLMQTQLQLLVLKL